MKEENVGGGRLHRCIHNKQDVEGMERLPSESEAVQPRKSAF